MNQAQFQFNQLERVSGETAPLVKEFLEGIGLGNEFHASDLYQFCLSSIAFLAPGSSCRVLRQMRKTGLVKYEIVNRRQSKYRIKELRF